MGYLDKQKVLIVDDDPTAWQIASHYLVRHGVSPDDIAVAKNGSEGVELATKQIFDLILMDIRLPIVDGIDAAEQIRKHHHGNLPKIIAYTAGQDYMKDKRVLTAMDGVIIKATHKFEERLFQILLSN